MDECSLWEFQAAADGYAKANSPPEGNIKPPSVEEHDELMAKYA